MFASRCFVKGDVVLEQDPYISVLNSNNASKRCDGCYKPGSSVKCCSACKHVWYCSSLCQRNEWKLHQHECRTIAKVIEGKQRTLTPSMQLMLRFLFKRMLQADGVFPSDPMDNYKIVEALPTHFSGTAEKKLVLYAQMSNLINIVCTPAAVDIREVTENFCRFACNAHIICDEELRPLGIGLFPVLSIINHSCHPNSIIMFEGKHAVIRAIETIEAGTEVTVSYVELGASTTTRQKELKEQYFFNCNCLRCMNPGNLEGTAEDGFLEGFRCLNGTCKGALVLYSGGKRSLACQACGFVRMESEVQKEVKEAENALKEANDFFSSGKIYDARHAYEHGQQLQAKVLHPYNVRLMRTYDDLLKVCMSLEDWTSALKYCRHSISIYQKAYPPCHPLLGLQFYTCGKLEWYLGNAKEAVKAMSRAMEILEVTHGSQSELVRNLCSALREAQAEDAYLQHHQTDNL
eukprot:c25124_g1_i1 orf=280-1665(-)